MDFPDDNPVFTRDDFAAAIGLPKGSGPVDRMLRQQVAVVRIKRLFREVFAAGLDHKTPGRLMPSDYVHASKCRPDGVLGHCTGLRLFEGLDIFAGDDVMGRRVALVGGPTPKAQCAAIFRKPAPPAN